MTSERFFQVFAILLLLSSASSSWSPHHCSVILENAVKAVIVTNDSNCDLAEVFSVIIENEIKLIIINGTVTLNESASVSNISGLTIQGSSYSYNSSAANVIECTENGGSLTFTEIKNLQISNVTITKCGSYNLNDNNIHEIPAIIIKNCIGVTIDNVQLSHNKAIGMIVSHSCNLQVTDSQFINNTFICPRWDSDETAKGGGLCIERGLNQSCWFNIIRCSFANNVKDVCLSTRKNFYGKGTGGGLEIIFKDTVGSNILINESNFTSNSAYFGGGMAIILGYSTNVVKNCTISVSNCNFLHNNVIKQQTLSIANGGGLHISMGHRCHDNVIIMYNCYYFNNVAYFGGGTSIDIPYENLEHPNNTLLISNCRWIHNTASSGAAVDVCRHFRNKPNAKGNIKTTFRDCEFTNNSVSYNKTLKESISDGGALSVIIAKITFESTVKFVNNYGSAISAIRSLVSFKECSAKFTSNTGIDGGAIYLVDLARLIIKNSTLNFTGNSAFKNGGAVYSRLIDGHALFFSYSCPFQITKHSIISFSNNTAAFRGSDIYMSSLIPCMMYPRNNTNNVMIPIADVFSNETFQFDTDTLGKHVATAPDKVNYNNKHRPLSMQVFPGEKNRIPVTFIDGMNNTVDSNSVTLQVSITWSNGTALTLQNTYITNNEFTILGEEDNNATLLFQTIEKPLLNININITTLKCPPVFKYDNDSKKCHCNPKLLYGVENCTDTNEYKAIIRGNVWAGFVNNVFVTAPCMWSCNETFHDISDKKHRIHQCTGNKESGSILCSKCKTNFTVYYRSDNFTCGEIDDSCNLGWLYFILLELLPVTLILIAIMFTGFNVVSGYSQGLFLYSHILCSLSLFSFSELHHFNHVIFVIFKNAIQLFYYPLVLKFFYQKDFCIIHNQLNSLHIIAFNYIKGFFGIILIIMIVTVLKCFARRFHQLNNYVRFTTAKNSAILGMSALLLLSFTNVMETSLYILQPVPLYKEGNEVYQTRVSLNGELVYLNSDHLKFAIPSILCMIVVMIPAFMLLLYPLVSQILLYLGNNSNSWLEIIFLKCFLYHRLKPFYDMFYGSFKDHHRYFAGLYLFYRVCIQVSYYLPNYTLICFVMETFLVSFLIIHALVQPYQNSVHNLIDGILLSLLVIINGLTCCNVIVVYNPVHNQFWNVKVAEVVKAVLALSPMAVVIICIVWKCVILRCCRYKRKFKQSLSIEHHRQFSMQESMNLINN
jgi:predicted outer membrane repeat protein